MQKSNIEELYPDICIYLRKFFTMPVSIANLRSFFRLKQIKIHFKIIYVPRKGEYCAYTVNCKHSRTKAPFSCII